MLTDDQRAELVANCLRRELASVEEVARTAKDEHSRSIAANRSACLAARLAGDGSACHAS